MQEIKDYIDRFFKSKSENRNYSLTTGDMAVFIKEFQSADGNGLFHTIALLFKYGYIKGCRACKAEQKKAGKME